MRIIEQTMYFSYKQVFLHDLKFTFKKHHKYIGGVLSIMPFPLVSYIHESKTLGQHQFEHQSSTIFLVSGITFVPSAFIT